MSTDNDVAAPGRARPLSSPGIIFFALALISYHDDRAANAPLLLAVAAELGLPEAACRAAILRLRRDGLVCSERLGRSARYSPSPAMAATQRRWTDHFQSGPPPWDGTFSGLLHDFTERDRARRDAFRHAARQIGYGLLRPGLLVSPDDRWSQLADRFADDERAGRILRLGLTLVDSDARRIARQLWRLDELGGRYRQIARDTRRALSRPSTVDGGASAIHRLYAVTQPIYAAIADDPALPAELLPADWPAHELGAALTAANRELGPPAMERVAALARQVGSARPTR